VIHLQGSTDNLQGAGHWNTSVPEQRGTIHLLTRSLWSSDAPEMAISPLTPALLGMH